MQYPMLQGTKLHEIKMQGTKLQDSHPHIEGIPSVETEEYRSEDVVMNSSNVQDAELVHKQTPGLLEA